MKTQWLNNWSFWTDSVTVSHRIGEAPWRSFSQSSLFITFGKVSKIHSWKSNKHS